MKKILFIAHNSGKACGGYDFGLRWLSYVQNTEKYSWIYREVRDLDGFDAAYNEVQPDAVIINLVPIAMGWVGSLVGETLAKYPVPRIVLEHNWSESTVNGILEAHFPTFEYLMFSDPSFIPTSPKVFNFSRPLHKYTPEVLNFDPNETVRIGTFGFPLPHKNFPLLVREVNRLLDNAVINMHLTAPTFTSNWDAHGNYIQHPDFGQAVLDGMMAECRAEITKPGIFIHHTSDFCSEEEVIRRLAQNHINALFYSVPDHNSGISSSMDFMLSAQRPILVTNCAVFNHLKPCSVAWPERTFTDILANLAKFETGVQDFYQAKLGDINAEATGMMDSIFSQD